MNPMISEIESLNEKIKKSIELNNVSTETVAIFALYVHTDELLRASMLLIKSGYLDSSKASIRCALESLFVMRALRIEPQNLIALENSYEKTKETIYNVIQNKNVFEDLKKELIKRDFSKPNESKYNGISYEEWAKKSELNNEYNLFYRTLSNDLHVNLKTIYSKLKVNSDNVPEIIIIEPQYLEIKKIMKIYLFIMIHVIEDMNIHFELNLNDEIGKYKAQYID